MRAKTNDDDCHVRVDRDQSRFFMLNGHQIYHIYWTSIQCVHIKRLLFCLGNGQLFTATVHTFDGNIQSKRFNWQENYEPSMCELNAIQCFKAVIFTIAIHLFRTWVTILANRCISLKPEPEYSSVYRFLLECSSILNHFSPNEHKYRNSFLPADWIGYI